MNGTFSRRNFIRLAGAFGIAGLARPAWGADNVVTVWSPLAAQDATRQVYTALAEGFEAANPGISTDVVSVGWSALRDKAFAAVRSRSGPDVIDTTTDQMPSYAALGGFADITEEFASSNLEPQLWDFAREYGSWNGKMYAIPWGIDTAMGLLYYRQDMFDAAGITAPPSTLEELVATAKALTREADGDKAAQWGLAFAGVPGDAFHGGLADIFYSHGGKLFDSSSGKTVIGINTPAMAQALQFQVDLLQEHKVVHPDSPSFNSDQMRTALIRGQAAMVPGGFRHWASQFTPLAKDLIDQGILRVALWPAGPMGRRLKLTPIGFHVTDFSDTDREAAWTFIRHAFEPDTLNSLGLGAGFAPMLKSAWDGAAYKELEVLVRLRELVENYAAPSDSHPLFVPVTRGIVERMISRALVKEVTVEAALENAQAEADIMLKEFENQPL